jgi:L-lactate dehydrogenase complex protein LldG
VNPVVPEEPVGPRRSWRVPATSARNSWRTPAVGPDPAWLDPAGGPTIDWHVPTSLAARTWQVPATGPAGRWRGTTGPIDLPDRAPASRGRATTQTTWCAPVASSSPSGTDTRAKLVAPVRPRAGCAVRDIDELADTLRALRFQALARVLEKKLAPEDGPEPHASIDEPASTPSEVSDARPSPPPPAAPSPEPASTPIEAASPPDRSTTAPTPPDDEPPSRAPEPLGQPPGVEVTDARSPRSVERRPAPRAGVVRGTEHGDRAAFLAEARYRLTGLRDLATRGDDPARREVPRPAYPALDAGDLVGSFRRAVERSGGVCHRVAGDVPDSLLDVLVAELDAWEIVVTGDPELHELSGRLANRGVEVTPATPDRATTAGMGVTCAVAGIAATGALVLDSRRDKGRLAALLPPVHLCVLPVERLVATPSDVLRALGDQPGTLSPSLTLVTGPSHTTNLERLLTVGTPGPSGLHVVLVDPHPDL